MFLQSTSLNKNIFLDYILVYMQLEFSNLSSYYSTEIPFTVKFNSTILILSSSGVR